MTALMLFSRDLRVADNETLKMAAQEQQLVCGVLAQDTGAWGQSKRQHYQSCLANLAYHLEQLGHRLYIINDLNPFSRIYCTRSYNSREHNSSANVDWVTVDQLTLYKPSELPFALSELPATFTPFRKQMDNCEKPPRQPFMLEQMPVAADFQAQSIAPVADGGETAALARLEEYFHSEHPLSYFDTRNGLLNYNDSTKFSPYLAWGCISPERIYFHLKQYEVERGANKSTYWILFELLWRDYFKFLSAKFADKLFARTGSADRQLNNLPVELEQKYFEQWCKAETEQPFINANMQELNQTGWMSNRGRQNVASFLCKIKGVSWLLGAEYFANHLIDYDVESNWGNWAYLAGVGVDPRDRVFNIERQAAMYDPDAAYQAKWLKDT